MSTFDTFVSDFHSLETPKPERQWTRTDTIRYYVGAFLWYFVAWTLVFWYARFWDDPTRYLR